MDDEPVVAPQSPGGDHVRSKDAWNHLLAVLGTGLLASGPAYACHERTGWCCTEIGTNYYCCYWENNVMREGSCKWQ